MSGLAPSSAEPKQLFLPSMFLPHEEESIEQFLNSKLEEKLRNHEKYLVRASKNPARSKLIDSLSASLFDMPLGSVEDVELSTAFDPYDEDIAVDQPSLTDEQAMQWSEDAIEQLHEGMVMYSLRLLNARGNGKEKKAILSWIFDPKVVAHATDLQGDEPTWEVIPPSDVPFGFELCCRLSGYDPDRIREGLVPILKKMDLESLFNEVENERTNEQRSRAQNVSNTLNIQYPRGTGKSVHPGAGAGPTGSTEGRPILCLRDRATS